MVDQFKQELIEFGTAQLPKFRPKDLDLYKEIKISKLLDKYGDKWMALNNLLWAKRQEILQRPDACYIDDLTLQSEYDQAVVKVRNKFMATYPLNL